MTAQTVEDRVTILLNLLGPEFADTLLAELPPERGDRIKKRLGDFATTPPKPKDVDAVLDEFERMLRFAIDAYGGNDAHGHAGHKHKKSKVESPPEELEEDDSPLGEAECFVPSDDPVVDIKRMGPLRLATALRDENTRTVAVVLNCVSSAKAGEVLQNMPSERRNEVFMQLQNPPQTRADVLQRMLAATVMKATRVDLHAVMAEMEDRDRKLAQMLRNMSRKQRSEVLEALEGVDADAATRVKDFLYTFDDLLRVDDRSLQKLLGEVDTGTLSVALKDGPQELLDKVLGNLSKRARESLAEEIELCGGVGEDERAAAQKRITQVMIEMDQKGELNMAS